jgi:hypothetical protein
MAKAKKPPAKKKRYFISFTVRDGDNKYGDDTILDCDHELTDEECVEHVIRTYCWGDTDKETEELVREAKALYAEDGYFEESPGYRHFTDIGIEKDDDDVRLHNAAPKLLECAKMLYLVAAEGEIKDRERLELFKLAEAAIAQAEG